EVLKEQEELIEDESEQEEALLKAKLAREAEASSPSSQPIPPIPPLSAKPPSIIVEVVKAPVERVNPAVAAPVRLPLKEGEIPAETASIPKPFPVPDARISASQQQPLQKQAASAIEDEDKILDDQLRQLGAALKVLTADSVFQDVRIDLAEIKLERAEFKEDIEELKMLAKAEPATATSRLGARVDKMLAKIEKEER
ncbi:hypothetical protein SeLEV6574_g05794, partial [Synchytrium endobioticum]